MRDPIDNIPCFASALLARVDSAHAPKILSAAEFLDIESNHLVPVLNEIADLFYFSALGLGVSAGLIDSKIMDSFYQANSPVLNKRFIENQGLEQEEITSLYMSATIKAAAVVDEVASIIPQFAIQRDDLQRYLAVLMVSVQVESLRTGEALLEPVILRSRFSGELQELRAEINSLTEKVPNFKAKTSLDSLDRVFPLAMQGQSGFQVVFQLLSTLAKRTVYQDRRRSLHVDNSYGLRAIMNNSLRKSLARNTAILSNTNEGYAAMKARLKQPEHCRTLADLNGIDVAL